MQANENRVTIRVPGDLSKLMDAEITAANGQRTKTEIILTALRSHYAADKPQEGGAQG